MKSLLQLQALISQRIIYSGYYKESVSRSSCIFHCEHVQRLNGSLIWLSTPYLIQPNFTYWSGCLRYNTMYIDSRVTSPLSCQYSSAVYSSILYRLTTTAPRTYCASSSLPPSVRLHMSCWQEEWAIRNCYLKQCSPSHKRTVENNELKWSQIQWRLKD